MFKNPFKQIDRLIFKELLGPWIFGVGMFTILIMMVSYLFRLTEYMMKGIPFNIIVELAVLLLPNVIGMTFSMAILLAGLLAFGRLSGDSEIVALKASGTSIYRIILPVLVFGILVSALSFLFTDRIVPKASLRAETLKQDIVKSISEKFARPQTFPIYEKGRLSALVSAKDFVFTDRLLLWSTIITYDSKGDPSSIFMVKRLRFHSNKEWKIEGGGTLLSANGKLVVKIKDDVWPTQVPQLRFTPKDIIARTLIDFDSMSMGEIGEQIKKAEKDPYMDPGQLARLRWGYWNKLSVPLGAIIFGLVGALAGIKSHRTGVASGFWLSILIIFAYLMLTNVMSIYAKGGTIQPWMASFAPVFIGLAVSMVMMYKKRF